MHLRRLNGLLIPSRECDFSAADAQNPACGAVQVLLLISISEFCFRLLLCQLSGDSSGAPGRDVGRRLRQPTLLLVAASKLFNLIRALVNRFDSSIWIAEDCTVMRLIGWRLPGERTGLHGGGYPSQELPTLRRSILFRCSIARVGIEHSECKIGASGGGRNKARRSRRGPGLCTTSSTSRTQ